MKTSISVLKPVHSSAESVAAHFYLPLVVVPIKKHSHTHLPAKRGKIAFAIFDFEYLLRCNQKGDYNAIKINAQQLHNVLTFVVVVLPLYFLVLYGVCKDHQLFYKTCDDEGDK